MQARLLFEMAGGPPRYEPGTRLEVGSIVQHPDAWRLVLNGCALPADEDCEKACDAKRPGWREEHARAQHNYLRATRGIAPEDFEAYDRGEMIGYYPDGSPIPGPNAPDASDEGADFELEDA